MSRTEYRLLKTLAIVEGLSIEEMLRRAGIDSVVPGICRGCGATTS